MFLADVFTALFQTGGVFIELMAVKFQTSIVPRDESEPPHLKWIYLTMLYAISSQETSITL